MVYDTIVIGNDLSSFIAAVSSAHRGRKTVLLSEEGLPDWHQVSGYTFNVDPMPLAGFGPDQTGSRFLTDYGIRLSDDPNVHRLNPAFQMILPDHRIDFFHDIHEVVEELAKEFINERIDTQELYISLSKISDAIYALLKENPYILPVNYKRFVMFLRNIPNILKIKLSWVKMHRMLQKNPSLKKIFEATFNWLSNLHINGNHSFSMMSPYILSLPQRGLYYHSGGKGSLMEALRSKFVACGGVWIKEGLIVGMALKDEINIEIKTCEERLALRGKSLIVSITSGSLDLLLGNRKFRRLDRRLKKVYARYYPFTLHMGVHNKVIPEKTAPYVVIMVEENSGVMDNDAVYVEISAQDDIRKAPAGKRTLSATVFLKDSPMCFSVQELEERARMIIKHLETFLPFLKENIDYLDVEASINLSRRYQKMMNQKYQIRGDVLFGINTLSGRTPMKNVYLTGGMLLAGLGFEGEILSGMHAAVSTITGE
jgi:phytoene dehydrogenase-like protein